MNLIKKNSKTFKLFIQIANIVTLVCILNLYIFSLVPKINILIILLAALATFILKDTLNSVNREKQKWFQITKFIFKALNIIIAILTFTTILFFASIRSGLLFPPFYENQLSLLQRLLFLSLIVAAMFSLLQIIQNLAKKRLGNTHQTTRFLGELIKPLLAAVTILLVIFAAESFAERYYKTHDYGINGFYFGDLPYYPGEVPFDSDFFSNRPYDTENLPEPPYLQVVNYSSPYYNVVNHLRKTTNQPDAYQNKIHIFGGSTVFNHEEPDYYTLPSYFQRLVNEQFPDTYKVVNHGILGVSSDTQLMLLEKIDLAPGDIVIFYDGVNDSIKYGLNYFVSKTRLHKTILSSNIFNFLRSRSYLYTYFLAPYIYYPSIMNDPAFWEESIRVTYMTNYRNSLSAQEIAESQGASFYHFLQPNIATLDRHSQYEKLLMKVYSRVANGWVELHQRNYPALYDAHQDMLDAGVTSFDITDALNHENRPDDAELYIDAHHITHLGNKIIAEKIFEIMEPYLYKNTQGED